MGAGKTTVGRVFARRHGLSFIDCDLELEARTGVSVATIFEIEGETGFRQRESALLEELLAQSSCVLATGGGVVLMPHNRQLLEQHACVAYLKAAPRLLWERTRHDKKRPLLQVADLRKRLETLYHERDPLYHEVADIVIDSGRGGPGGVVQQLENALLKMNLYHD